MSKSVPLYPYAVSDALRLRLADFDDPTTGEAVNVRDVSGPDVGEDTGMGAAPVYDVTSNRGWRKLTFRLAAELPDDEIARVLPSTSRVAEDTSLVVLVTCASTRYRHGVRLRRTTDGTWTGHATLQRDDVEGVVLLRPQLVRTTGIPAEESLPYATKAGTLVAVGSPVALHLDSQPKLGLNSSVVMLWEDFSNSDEPWRREHGDDVYHLEPFGAEPRLWLNSRYGQLRDVLESNAKRGPEAVLRDMTALLIAQPVMLQLCTAALASLEADNDSGAVSLPTGWRGDTLAMVLPRLYPEESGEDERMRRAATDIRESDGASGLSARLGTVVQELLTSYKTIEAAVRSFESVRDREESPDD